MAGYVALAWGVFLFAAVTLIFRPVGERYDLVKRRVSGVLQTDRKKDILDEELSKPLSERILRPAIKALSSKFAKYSESSERSGKKKQSSQLRKMLHQAGMSINVSEYSFLRFAIAMICGLLFGTISFFLGFGIRSILLALLGIYAGYAFMRFRLTSQITNRRKSMEQQLPDVLDLLSINVEAGLGFEQALLHVIGHFEGPIVDELTITYREMTMGRPRREALSLLAERCEMDDMKTFVGSIIQAEQLGISIKNVLRAQAAAMRTSRRNKVQEKAMKISVKILLPMVGFIFPVLFIVLMGPAVVKIVEMFAS